MFIAPTTSTGRAIVSTNFRPYEAVILHLVTQAQPDIPVLWVDHGYNREATYKHAEELKALLKLNIQAFVPKLTAAHYDFDRLTTLDIRRIGLVRVRWRWSEDHLVGVEFASPDLIRQSLARVIAEQAGA